MELILCNTNLSVTTVVTQLFSNKTEQFIVFTDQNNIFSFLKLLQIPNVRLYYIKSSYNIRRIYNLFIAKKQIKKFFNHYSDIKKVHCYHQAFGGIFNWIITYAYQQGIIIEYNRVLSNQEYPEAKFSIKKIKIWFVYKVLFQTDVFILDRGNNTLMPKLHQLFYKRNKINECAIEVDNAIIKKVSQLVIQRLGLSLNESSIVYLSGSVIATKQVSLNEYTKKITTLIESLNKSTVICKCHPRFTDEIIEEQKLLHIPAFIPMEFLLPYFNVFIGYNSTILCKVAKSNKIAISLLDYFIPISKERRDLWYKYFGDAKVLRPKTINEIKDIIYS